MSRRKSWVYECLVENDEDPVGLIAYAFYKKSKHELASSLRQEGKPEAEILEAVKNHHDTVLQSKQLLAGFTREAQIFLTEILNQVETKVKANLESEHSKKVAELEKKEKKALEAAIRDLKAAAANFKSPGLMKQSINWVLNGFSGVIAALITTVIIGGILYYNAPESQRQLIKQQAVESVINKIDGG